MMVGMMETMMEFPNLSSLPAGSTALVLVVVVSLPIVWICNKYIKWKLSPLQKLPGPRSSSFLFGEFLIIFKEPFFKPHTKWFFNDYNKAPLISYCTLLGRWGLLITDPNLVKLVLTSPSAKEPVRYKKNFDFFKYLVGDGLVSLEGSVWSRHRRILQPCFQTSILREALQQAVPTKVSLLVEAWKQSEGRIIDVHPHMSAVTLDILGEVSFGHNFHALDTITTWSSMSSKSKNEEDDSEGDDSIGEIQDPLIQNLSKIFKPSMIGIVLNIMKLAWLQKYISSQTSNQTKQLLDDAATNILQNAAKAAAASSANNKDDDDDDDATKQTETTSTSSSTTKSLIHILLDAYDKDNNEDNSNNGGQGIGSGSSTDNGQGINIINNRRNSLTYQEMKDEIKLFIIAGHETTSTWCYWALYVLGKYPDIQQRVLDDIQKHCRTSSSSSSTDDDDGDDDDMIIINDLDQISKMEYFLAFLQETLRLYSPAGMIFRFTNQIEYWNNTTIPKNTRIVIPIFLLHRHPDYWVDPFEFKPERWLDASQQKMKHPFCFLPFSAGGRNCIGEKFARNEAQLILVNLINQFQIKLAPSCQNQELEFRSSLTMKSKPTVQIIVKSRR